MQEIKLGLLGCGTVGTGVVRLLQHNSSVIQEKLGAKLTLKRIAVRDTSKVRDIALAPGVVTDDFESVLADPEIAIIVELIGGDWPA
ncbi:MAG: homoserine dehydrogenase, partial [Desulfobulbus sp.]|nr:homoserine dehydrogenase [Desulfobulbus sp.]